MAAPQFSTSGSGPRGLAKGAPAHRCYTLDQANRSLPLVSRVVRDIVNAHEAVTQLHARLEEAPPSERRQVQGQLDESVERLQGYVDELTTLGIELKDLETGLIDFPGRHQGRDVYLCWRLGEERVGHWHELHAGFAGRQSVRSLEETD